MLRISDKNRRMIVSSNHSRLTTKIYIRCFSGVVTAGKKGVKKVRIKRAFHGSPKGIVDEVGPHSSKVVVVVVVEPDVVVVLGVVVYLF